MYTILGAGLSGLSVADHLRKRNIPFEIFEDKAYAGGHIHSEIIGGFTWDEGPHVSFTKYTYVKEYFAENCAQNYLEYVTDPINYYQGNWIMHPAQAHMYAVPEPLRHECIEDAIAIRAEIPEGYLPANYQEWINYAFGKTFAEVFSKSYTLKYWTTEPVNLTTNWIGKRIYFPEISDMVDSAMGPLAKQTHYINKVRYPASGGFYSYIKEVADSLPINFNKKLTHISFKEKRLSFSDGSKESYDKLISTLPLPMLIINSDAPVAIKNSAMKLKCSQLLIINIVVDHPAAIHNQWIYVYDEGFYSTRINFTDLLSPANGMPGKSGIQVEVYFSEYHIFEENINYAEKVLDELINMNLIHSNDAIESYHTKWVDWANVIFDQEREIAQNVIFTWLESLGMTREEDDLEPMSDWETKKTIKVGDIVLAGRFAQWKYFWTDDCVMRAKYIVDNI